MITKQGAMFGLDARIALAIFGALSVISGAALYSAIQNAKVTSLLTEIKEVEKAIEAYVLDTGSDIELKTGITAYGSRELLSGTKSGWKGPYLSYEPQDPGSADTHFEHNSYNRIAIDYRVSGEDGFTDCSDAGNKGKTCYYWVFFGEVTDTMIKALDVMVDGAEGANTGLIYDSGNGGIYYRSLPILQQPNP